MRTGKVISIGMSICFLVNIANGVLAQNEPDLEITHIIDQLKVGEKIDLLCANAPGVERLDIPAYDWWNECLHGVARNGKATVFPKPIALGCMWDTKLMKRIADAISEEARAKYMDVLKKKGITGRYEGLTFFSPTLNIARDPRWGRTSECFSEDPLLTSEMGLAFVNGLQGDDPYYLKLVATPKHFVANNEENRRADGSANVDEVSLREYYFPAFQTAVEQGKATSVMGAYNALNGIPCCANSFLLTDVLRKEWGFDGVVMSDGSAIGNIAGRHKYRSSLAEGAATALSAGCDMSLRDEYRKGLRQALEHNLIKEEDIDTALRRVLKLRKRLGILTNKGNYPYPEVPIEVVECQTHRDLAYEAACKSIVLLKNDNLLPLNINKFKKVALIGSAFKEVYYGDYSGKSEHNITLFDALKCSYGDKANFLWADENVIDEIVPENNLIRGAQYEYEGKLGLTGRYYKKAKIEGQPDVELHDLSLDFKAIEVQELKKFDKLSAYWESSLLPSVSGIYVLSLEGGGNIKMYLDGKLVLNSFQNRGKASVSLPLIGNRHYDLRIECENMNKNDHYRFLWRLPIDESKSLPEQIAKEADVAIIFIRDNGGAEGRDRNSLSMNPEQIALVQRITRANENTIVVLGSSAPLLLEEITSQTKALLNVWVGGQGEAQAIADILFGRVNPSGKTAVTFYADETQLPPLDSYNVKQGRSYQYFKGEELFPFGYGLSYTEFAYSDLRLDNKLLDYAQVLRLSVKIRNKGKYDGDEVIQCYASSNKWNQEGLKQRLIAFERVHIKAGETKIAHLEIPINRLRRWNVNTHSWEVQPGSYQLTIAPNSHTTNKKVLRTIVSVK